MSRPTDRTTKLFRLRPSVGRSVRSSVRAPLPVAAAEAEAAGLLKSAAEHVGPELHEFGFVEASVAILVEHLDEGDRPLLVDAHHVLYDLDDFLRTEHAVAVLVQLGEALRYLLVSARTNGRTQERPSVTLSFSRKEEINETVVNIFEGISG